MKLNNFFILNRLEQRKRNIYKMSTTNWILLTYLNLIFTQMLILKNIKVNTGTYCFPEFRVET